MADAMAAHQQESADAWVLDSLVGFLKGPVWIMPLLTFVEEKSVVFEPEECDQHDDEYTKIFEEYKNLVDKLLASHMDDLGIEPPQFEQACRNAKGALSAKFHQTLFEQIWAANDYVIFKRMMIQRNIDLQLQALEILANRYGLVPESFLPDGTSREAFLRGEDAMLDAVLKRSLNESEAEKAIEEASKLLEQELVLNRDDRSAEMRPTTAMSIAPDYFGAQSGDVPPTRAFSRLGAGSATGSAISAEEIKKRQAYLREQRDKLITAKHKERRKQLSEKLEENEMLSQQRPKSAKALKSFVDDDSTDDDDKDDKGVAFRMSLAARLKAEVIDKERNE